MLEILFGVNVLGALLQLLFAGAFLTGGFGDALVLLVLRLVLGARNRGAESRAAEKKNCGCRETDGTRDPPHAWATRLERHEAVWVSKQHGKPTTGGHRVRKSVSKFGAIWKTNSFGGSWA